MLKRSLSILTLNLLLIISGMSLGMSFGRLKEPLLEPKNSGDYSLVDVTESEAGAGRSMLSGAKTRDSKEKDSSEKIKFNVLKTVTSGSWATTYLPTLIVTGSGCAIANQLFVGTGAEPLSIFASHAFAEQITRALKSMNYQLKTSNLLKSTTINVTLLLTKLAIIQAFWMGINYIELQIPNAKWGIGDAIALAQIYTAAEHFTDEKNVFQKEFEHELDRILQDPEYAEKIAQSTVKTVIEKPEIVAQNIYDKELAKRLEEFKKDPAKMEQFQRAWEAQWARFVREAMDIVPRQEITAADAASAAGVGSHDAAADSGAGAAGAASAEPKADDEAGPADRKGKGKAVVCTLDKELRESLEANRAFLAELTREENKALMAEYIRESAKQMYQMMKAEEKQELAALAVAIGTNHEKASRLQRTKQEDIEKKKSCVTKACHAACTCSDCCAKKEELKLARPVAEEWIQVVVTQPDDSHDAGPATAAVATGGDGLVTPKPESKPKESLGQWFKNILGIHLDAAANTERDPEAGIKTGAPSSISAAARQTSKRPRARGTLHPASSGYGAPGHSDLASKNSGSGGGVTPADSLTPKTPVSTAPLLQSDTASDVISPTPGVTPSAAINQQEMPTPGGFEIQHMNTRAGAAGAAGGTERPESPLKKIITDREQEESDDNTPEGDGAGVAGRGGYETLSKSTKEGSYMPISLR